MTGVKQYDRYADAIWIVTSRVRVYDWDCFNGRPLQASAVRSCLRQRSVLAEFDAVPRSYPSRFWHKALLLASSSRIGMNVNVKTTESMGVRRTVQEQDLTCSCICADTIIIWLIPAAGLGISSNLLKEGSEGDRSHLDTSRCDRVEVEQVEIEWLPQVRGS